MQSCKAVPGGVLDIRQALRILEGCRGHVRDARYSLRGALSSLEAWATKHGPTLPGRKGNSGICSAGGAGGPGLGTRRLHGMAMLRPTGRAAFRFILELHDLEEDLLAGGKHEFSAAIGARQGSVDEFHNCLLPSRGRAAKDGHEPELPENSVDHYRGPGVSSNGGSSGKLSALSPILPVIQITVFDSFSWVSRNLQRLLADAESRL